MIQGFIKAFNKANETMTQRTAGQFEAAARRKLDGFRKKEEGSVIIFGLYMFICMMIISGMALDAIQREHLRTKVQYTTDRCLLAAASMSQTLDAQDICDDYFAKAGLKGLAPTATVDSGLNYRKVSAKYDPDNVPSVKTIFMSKSFRELLQQEDAGGIDELEAYASGVAVDGVEKVEISLVLDVSGSMYGSKLADLKEASKDFFDTLLLDQPAEDTYSISIVPYSTQVNAGANLLSKYNATAEHNYSHCVDFVDNDFSTAALSPLDTLQRTGHFAPHNSYYRNKPVDWKRRPCPPIAARAILPLNDDINVLKNYVDAFEANGNTSTDVGIKWGAALLDPSAQTVVTSLITDGDIDPKFTGRPFSYTEENTLKVIVVMSDGNNTSQYYLKPEVSGGYSDNADNMSNVWKYTWTYYGREYDRYAIYNPNRYGSYKYMHTNRESTYGNWKSSPPVNGGWTSNGRISEVEQMSYVDLYDHATVRYVAKYLMNPAGYDYNHWRYGIYSYVHPSDKDVRMNNICEAAKNKDVLIFTIGFEVTDSNATKLSNCASTAGHFFRVEGVEISEAFASIAAQLHRLRLER